MKSDEKSTQNAFDLMQEFTESSTSNDIQQPTVIDATGSFFDIPLEIEPKEPEITKSTVKTETIEKEDDDTLKVIELPKTDDYSDYNEFALIALGKVRSGNWNLEESEIPKDLDAATLMDMMDLQEKTNQEKYQSDLYTQAGEFASYIKFLMDGGSREVVEDAISIKKITLLDPSIEENQKEILTAYLELKGVEEDTIEDTIETILDKGKGKQKSDEALEALKKYEENIIATEAKRLEDQKLAAKQNYEKHINDITTVVKKGKVGGISVDATKQTQIINAMFKPTEVVKYTDPKTGEVKTNRITKATALFNEMNANPEKLAAMVLWLLEGGSFESIKDEIKENKDDELRNLLRGRRTATVINKQSNSSNGFEVLANRANQII